MYCQLTRLFGLIALFFSFGYSQSLSAATDSYSTGPGVAPSDGMCDVWQSLFNGWGLDPNGDEDKDGCSNLIESISGTDPRAANDCIRVGNLAISAGNVVFTFVSEAGKVYKVRSDDAPDGTFATIETQTFPTNGQTQYIPTTDGASEIIRVSKAPGSRKFYKLEVSDADSDNDGVSDWAERKTGTNPNLGTSGNNASGGAATDGAVMASLLSIQATVITEKGFERVDKTATTPVTSPAKVGLTRSVGTMALTLPISVTGGAPDLTKSNVDPGDFNASPTINLPTNGGVGTPFEININPVQDGHDEVPEYAKVTIGLPNVPTATGPSATVCICESNPANDGNDQLYVAFLGHEAGQATTASGYATALVNGDNTQASISIVFNNLSSLQNTAYIRLGPNNDLAPALPLGQVSGHPYDVKNKPGFLATDQAFLAALVSGNLGCAVTSANFSDKEIFGYFNRANGSTTFDPENPTLDAPALGSANWENPTGEALEREIWRFLGQSTFGGTQALYDEVLAEVQAAVGGGGTYLTGLSNWLDKQMNSTLTPSVNFMTLVMAADNEEFMLRGNKPITFGQDPQFNGAAYNVTYDALGNPTISTTADNNRISNNYPQSGPNRRREWWTMILQCKDQVRQRMALALSEILVISEADQTVLDRHYGAANFWDMLATGAFGKFRPLLEQVSYSPMMGFYLSHISNRATYDAGGGLIVSPDENYAREIMQLFSIGLVLRHPDGSLVLDGAGLPIPTYDQTDITELARVMTGWSHGARNSIAWVSQWNGGTLTWNHQSGQRVAGPVLLNGGSANSQWFGSDAGHLFFPTPWIYPMKLMGRINTTVYHDFVQYTDPETGLPVSGVSKRLLAGKHGQFDIPLRTPPVATGYSNDVQWHNLATMDMTEAHNCLAGVASASTYGAGTQGSPGHQNTPVNISRWLIQRLITSNPSNGYIYRVSEAYRSSNGQLGQVLKAILLDYEARSLQLADTSIAAGKVKEPLVALSSMLRSLRAFSGAPVAILKDNAPSFGATDSPLPGPYPQTEYDKFSLANANPPSLPAGWAQGPFRYRFNDLTSSIGQSPQRAPSVFNWFMPDYVKPGAMAEAGLFAPELQISTESSDVAKANFFYNYTLSAPVGTSSQPGTDLAISDFLLNNNSATAAAFFTVNGTNTNTLTFTPGNYSTNQTVTVTAINNSLLSNISNGLLRFNVSGSGSGYENVVAPAETLTVTDDELPNEGILALHTSFSTWVQEGGNTDTVNVRLTAPPMAGVNVTVNVDDAANQVTVSPSSLVFNSTNWNTNQVVTVTAVNDAVSEAGGTANDTINLTAVSASANFNGRTASLPVNVIDNNDGGSSQGVIITESGGGTAVDEATGSDTYQIRLSRAPTASVVVAVAALNGLYLGTTGTGTTQNVTFTTSNWSTNQTVTVRANNDGTAEASYPANPIHMGSITHVCNNAGGYTSSIPVQTLGVPILDNDERIILAHVGNNETRVKEGGEVTDQITVRLRTAPTVDVTVTLASNDLKCDPAFLTFTPANFATNQTVTISAQDDFVKEGLQSALVENSITIQPTATTTLTGGAVAGVTITNGGAGYTVPPLVSFGGAPTGGVTATGVAQISAAGAVTSIIVLSPGSGYVTAPAVTIQPPPYGGGLIMANATSVNSADANYNGYWSYTHSALKATIIDNDSAGVIITQTGGNTVVGEGGATDTYTVALSSPPTSNVTVNVAPLANTAVPPVSQALTDVSSLTFTPANWNIAQTVTVSALNDASVEGDANTVIYHTVQSSDASYGGIQVSSVPVTVVDNDLWPAIISHLDGYTAVAEGGPAYPATISAGTIYSSDVFRVRLPFNPSSPVTVTLTSDSQVTLSPSTLNFTTSNGTTNQDVIVTVVNDTVGEASPHTSVIRLSMSSADARYNNPDQPPLIIDVHDNDAPGFIIGETDANNTQTQPFGGATRPTETSSDNFTVVLTKEPASNVVINVTSATPADATVSPSVLTFTPANWMNRQTVTVNAIADQIVESREPVTITLSVNDATSDDNFDPLPDQAIPVWLFNNPRRNEGLIVVQTGNSSHIVEGGKSDSLRFYLSNRPDVNVAVSIDTNAQLGVDQNTFVFTPANWNVPQTVNVHAIDDPVVEDNHTSNLQWRCNSLPQGTLVPGDARWTFVNPATGFNIVDNDPDVGNLIANRVGMGVAIEESGGDTRTVEGGSGGTNQDSYTVRLTTPPNGNVAINVTSSSTTAGQTVSPTLLTFNPTNWDQPQTVTVTVANDSSVEQFHTSILEMHDVHVSNITHSINLANTTDTLGYAALTGIQTVANFITDNDNRILVTPTGMDTRVHEDGTVSDSYSVALRSAPASNVTVNVNLPANQGFTRSPASLVFTNANWSTPQTVSLTGLDNGLNDRFHTADITHSSTSGDPLFNAQTIPNVRVQVIATDVPQILLYESGSTTVLTEGGQSDDYFVGLSHAPTGDVTVTITSDAQQEIINGPTTLTFTPANWGTMQRVFIRAIDDVVAEATPHIGSISHTVASSDPVYNGMTMAGIPTFITDNDYPAVRVILSGGSTLLKEGGATDTYEVYLTRQPSSDVLISILPDAQATVAAPGSTLTFTNSNWANAQVVTLAAVNDASVESTHTAVVNHTATSADPNYSGIGVPSVNASVTDNDGPQLTITHTGGSTSVTEGGSSDTFQVSLTTAPTADVSVTLVPPVYIIPVPSYGKEVGYYTSDQAGGNQQRDRVVMDFAEIIQLYRTTFYNKLETVYGTGNVPSSPADIELQNAHWLATKAIIDRMDLWWNGGSLKARFPVLIEPNQALPDPMPAPNPRQVILEAIYYLNGGNNNLSTTRFEPEIVFDPKVPPNTTFANEVRDRARWAAYLMSTAMPGFVAH